MEVSKDQSLDAAEELMIKGQYVKALHSLEKFEKQTELPINKRLECYLLKSRAFLGLGEFRDALTLSKRGWKENKSLDNPLQALDFLIVMIQALWRLGRHDESLEKIDLGEQKLNTIDQSLFSEITTRQSRLLLHKGNINILKGIFPQALEDLKQSMVLSKKVEDTKTLLKAIVNTGVIYRMKGDFDQALRYYQQGLDLINRMDDKTLLSNTYNNLGVVYMQKGDFDQALKYYKRSLLLDKKKGNKTGISKTLGNISSIYRRKGELTKALNYQKQSLTLLEELGNKQNIAAVLNNLSSIYYQKGQLDLALKHYRQSLSIFKDFGNKQLISEGLNNISTVYLQKGELSKALGFAQKSLALREQIGNNKHIALSLDVLAQICRQKGELNQALAYLERSLHLKEEIGDKLDITQTLFILVNVSLDQSNLEQAEKYLQQLQAIHNQVENKIISQTYRLGRAQLLKARGRLLNTMKAHELLEQIAEEEIVDYSLTIVATLQLCELFLLELNIFGDIETLEKIKNLTQSLLNLAEKQQSHQLKAEIYVLQSRLALLELDMSKAQQLLDFAQSIAEERGLQRLLIKILSDQKTYQKLKNLSEQTTSMAKSVELLQLKDLIVRINTGRVKVTQDEAIKYTQEAKQLIKAWNMDKNHE
ncbi:MAG: tetratricopeptide repeat protein [Candidatus Hodarchaeota archaeon]